MIDERSRITIEYADIVSKTARFSEWDIVQILAAHARDKWQIATEYEIASNEFAEDGDGRVVIVIEFRRTDKKSGAPKVAE